MKKILIVDDEEDIRDLIVKKLTQNQYAVITASTGQEALFICNTNTPDLILLDIAMPGMDGYEVCKKLKEDRVTKDIPIILLTGKDLDPKGIIEHYRDTGACGYIPKPSTFQELLGKIKEILG